MKTYPLRYCTGGCSAGDHAAHAYTVDPVDGPLGREYLCPGNLRQVREWLDDDGNGTLDGFVKPELPTCSCGYSLKAQGVGYWTAAGWICKKCSELHTAHLPQESLTA